MSGHLDPPQKNIQPGMLNRIFLLQGLVLLVKNDFGQIAMGKKTNAKRRWILDVFFRCGSTGGKIWSGSTAISKEASKNRRGSKQQKQTSGQIIATSHDLTSKGS